jgi:tetratricopeptide (TPR) repeat protein
MAQMRSKSQDLLIYIALALSIFIAFRQVTTCKFVHLDDGAYVVDNPHVTAPLTRQSFAWAFTGTHSGNWHPLTSLSHILDYQLFGLNPTGHHIVNLIFHIISTLLLFWVLKKMTGQIWPSAFVAAAFALHPLHVESVAWVSERKDVLSGLFWILTIAAYVWYAQRPAIRRYLLVVLVFCLGLMAKPMLVTLPFVLLLLDYWPLNRFRFAAQNSGQDSQQSPATEFIYPKSSVRRLILEKVPMLIPAAALSMAVFMIQRSLGFMWMTEKISLNFRAANAVVSYLGYISKMLYPVRLSVFYLYPKVLYVDEAALLLLGISVLAVRWARHKPWLIVGWLWYLGTLVPVIGLIQVGNQAMADRYTYLPSIGFFIMVTWGVADLFPKSAYKKIILGTSACIVLSILLYLTRMQVKHWQNDLTLFSHATKVTEGNFAMHEIYGYVLLEAGQPDLAIEQLNEALRINPYDYKAHSYLGLAFIKQGRTNEALDAWERALKINPDYPDALFNMGVVDVNQGKYDQAIKCFQEVLRIDPEHQLARKYLQLVFSKQNKTNNEGYFFDTNAKFRFDSSP